MKGRTKKTREEGEVVGSREEINKFCEIRNDIYRREERGERIEGY